MRRFALLSLALLLAAPAGAGLPRRVARGLSTLDGAPLDAKALAGKVVLLEFWTTRCAPCHEARPGFEQLQRRFASRGVVVLSVDHREDAQAVRRFLEKHPTSLRVLLDARGEAQAALGLRGQPAMALFDSSGRLNWSAVGVEKTTWDELAARLERLGLGEAGSVPVGALR